MLWAYRRRVRLSLWFNPNTKQIDMGFRQKNTNDLIPVQSYASSRTRN